MSHKMQVLSLDPETMRCQEAEAAMQVTASVWPYRGRFSTKEDLRTSAPAPDAVDSREDVRPPEGEQKHD